jgi:Fur family ferric uptake transcriptional regulator
MARSSTDILQSKKLRVTSVRENILTLLLSNDRAVSTKDIEKELKQVDRITLYRTLKAFEEKGVVHKIDDGTGVAKYALCIDKCDEDHHHDDHVHFHCNDCGDTFCVEEIEVPYIKTPSKLKVDRTSIVMNGTCERCQ